MLKITELIDMMRKLKSPYITITKEAGMGVLTKIHEYASSHDLKVFKLAMAPWISFEFERYHFNDENISFLHSEKFEKINNDEYILVITDIKPEHIDWLTHQILHKKEIKPQIIFVVDIEPQISTTVADIANKIFNKE